MFLLLFRILRYTPCTPERRKESKKTKVTEDVLVMGKNTNKTGESITKADDRGSMYSTTFYFMKIMQD